MRTTSFTIFSAVVGICTVIILLRIYVIPFPEDKPSTETLGLFEQMEAAYMEAQISALRDEVKIAKDENNCWYWLESPWDAGRVPKYTRCEE